MNKNIQIHLKERKNYQNIYNENILSYELSNYIIEQTNGISHKDKIHFEIVSDFEMDDREKNHFSDMLRSSFGTDVGEIIHKNKKQLLANLIIFIIGMLFLVLYYLISPDFISELTLILGWVFIGESICNFLYKGIETKINIKKKKQIIDAKIEFN